MSFYTVARVGETFPIRLQDIKRTKVSSVLVKESRRETILQPEALDELYPNASLVPEDVTIRVEG